MCLKCTTQTEKSSASERQFTYERLKFPARCDFISVYQNCKLQYCYNTVDKKTAIRGHIILEATSPDYREDC